MSSRKQWIRIVSILSFVVVSMAAIALANPPAPVLFLHGLSSDATAWERLSDILSLTDWTFGGCPLVNPSDDSVSTACSIPVSQGDYYRVQFSNNEGRILDQGEELKIIIDYVLSLNPKCEKVILVAHIMGGLAARSYLQFFSDNNNVFRLITIGTPHQGAKLAEFCRTIPWCKPDSIAIIDLDPDSIFLFQLNNLIVSPLPNEVEYTSIIGIDVSLPFTGENGDGVVSATSQNLSNVEGTESLNHLSIPIELECRVGNSVEAHRCEPDDANVWVAILTQALASDRLPNPIDLSGWQVVQYPLMDQGDAVWSLSENNTVATQERNADASIFLSDIEVSGKSLIGELTVSSAFDDDIVGLVFGYQGRGRFYLFDWVQTTQFFSGFGTANEGMRLRIRVVPQ